ncbi:putative diguanylate cyclase [Hyphomonas neptunium ATCC 15444]|uniref:Putative diguanylate cyclase n=2 Tax=Hyphomonas TaxID=85 RepID=Q0BZ19_HYPNA|nr:MULTISPECIES: GGDEF domain-containing phosphodiesterase [Hyphomonas]ABI76228.1 putative diguanylate cyclase [Hyphomonas neptunium ATCC 15444]KCZ87270.1 putative diguanylate cyclase [Hyphomonas hirschiana VP5]
MPIRSWVSASLRRKLTVIYSALFGLILLLVAGAVYLSIKINAERTVERELAASVAIFERLWNMSSENMTARAEVLASDYGFREAVATEDYPTIASAIGNVSARAEGLNAIVAFPDGRYVSPDGTEGSLPDDMLEAMFTMGKTSGVVTHEGANFQSVAVPIEAPVLVGWAVFWSDLDEARMHALEELSPIPVKAEIRRSAEWDGEDGEIHKTRGWIGASRHIRNFGAGEQMSLVITYPLQAAMAPYRPMMWAIISFSIFGAGLLVVSGGLVARSLTQPIATLDEAVHALAAGNRQPVAVTGKDEFGRLASSFNMMLEDLEAREAAIVTLSREDMETGLPNRRAMNDDIDARGGDVAVRIAVIRVLRFRKVRASIGHAATAQAMKILAGRIQEFTGALPYRINGADLGLIFEPGSRFATPEALTHIVGACSQPVMIEDASVDLMLCSGLAIPDAAEVRPLGLIDQAVIAADMAEANQAPSAAFDLARYGNPASTLSLMSEMLKATRDGGLSLHYQPKFSLKTNTVCGLEALIRWDHPQQGRIYPDTFIPLAEETGHIRQLTEWVVIQAIEDQRALRQNGYELPISVNISGRQLNEDSFALWAIGKIRSSGAKLCFEITETAVISDPDKALRLINLFRAAGISISIDDYGAGLSSLSYLKQIPAHELKIDKSFILTVEDGKSDQLMIQSTIDLAHAMGMSVVAEGVENERVVELLRAMGADTVQGYHISRPLTLETTLSFLRAQNPQRDIA